MTLRRVLIFILSRKVAIAIVVVWMLISIWMWEMIYREAREHAIQELFSIGQGVGVSRYKKSRGLAELFSQLSGDRTGAIDVHFDGITLDSNIAQKVGRISDVEHIIIRNAHVDAALIIELSKKRGVSRITCHNCEIVCASTAMYKEVCENPHFDTQGSIIFNGTGIRKGGRSH